MVIGHYAFFAIAFLMNAMMAMTTPPPTPPEAMLPMIEVRSVLLLVAAAPLQAGGRGGRTQVASTTSASFTPFLTTSIDFSQSTAAV